MTEQEVQQPKPKMSGALRWKKIFSDVAEHIDGVEGAKFPKHTHFLYFIHHEHYTDEKLSAQLKMSDYVLNYAYGAAEVMRSILEGTVKQDAGRMWTVSTFLSIVNSQNFAKTIGYPDDIFECFFGDVDFDLTNDFPDNCLALRGVDLHVRGQNSYKEYIAGLLMYLFGDEYKPQFEEDEVTQPTKTFQLPQKYVLEAAAYVAFETDFYGNPEKYRYLRYGQAFSDFFKIDKMNDQHDPRIRRIYELDDKEAKSHIFALFDFN